MKRIYRALHFTGPQWQLSLIMMALSAHALYRRPDHEFIPWWVYALVMLFWPGFAFCANLGRK